MNNEYGTGAWSDVKYYQAQTTAKMYAGSKYGRPPAEKGPRIERLQISEEEQSEIDRKFVEAINEWLAWKNKGVAK
jgi:hypothetical protein